MEDRESECPLWKVFLFKGNFFPLPVGKFQISFPHFTVTVTYCYCIEISNGGTHGRSSGGKDEEREKVDCEIFCRRIVRLVFLRHTGDFCLASIPESPLLLTKARKMGGSVSFP